MVARSGGYYAPPFKGYCGVNQGYPMYPKIFNVVVDSFIFHWFMVVLVMEVGVKVLGV